jgi:FkbM family methyltransferase
LIRLIRDKEYRLLQTPGFLPRTKARGQPGKISYRGLPVAYVDAPSLISAWDEIFVNRIYDIGEASHPHFVDCGANIGLAELYWKCRYPDFTSACFEPDPGIYKVLVSNLSAWRCATEAVQRAVGAADGFAGFAGDGADSGRLLAKSAASVGQTTTVRVTRLSPFLERPVDLLKIDVEGAELEVMEECRHALGNVKRVFVECHSLVGKEQDYMDVLCILRECGFRCYPDAIVGPRAPLSTGIKPYRGIDLNLNVFGVRV